MLLPHDAKTSGGIKAFSTQEESVLKWCLNRSEQAKNTKELQEMCGLGNDLGIYKPCRPSQISKSEKLVQNVLRTLMEEYINTFDVAIDKESLINLSSGVPLNDEATEFLLSSPEKGKEKRKEFVEKRLHQREILVHDPIK
jgi:hypothetical protein